MRKLCASLCAARFFFGLVLIFTFALVCQTAALGQTITLDAPASHSTSQYGQPLTISGTVTPADGWDIVVFDNKTYLGSATVSGGTFSFTTSSLPVGLHVFFAYGTNAGTVRNSGIAFHTITAAPSTGFAPAVPYPIDGGGLALTVADIDGNGNADLLVACGLSLVTPLMGAGDGTFTKATQLTVGTDVRSIAAGDFNKDRRTDFVVTSYTDNTIKIYLADGSGGWISTSLATPTGPVDVLAADFNADAKLDIAVLNRTDNSVSIFLGDGAGNFAPRMDFPNSGGPSTIPNSFTLMSYNGDSYPDFVIATSAPGATPLMVLPSTGPATYGPAVAYGGGTWGVAVADIDANGPDDVVSTDYYSPSSVYLSRGDTSGNLLTYRAYATPDHPGRLALADIDGDGHLDIAMPIESTNSVRVLYGDGTGEFGNARDFPVGSLPRQVVAGDFNKDGRTDLAVVNLGDNTVSILLGQSAGDPDMTVHKYHSGSFIKGQQGAAYTLDVYNSGNAASTGTVTVTDPLPAGLTFNSVSGTGWSCTTPAVGANGTVSCSRSDALTPGNAYPGINLLVNVLPTASDFVNIATISGGGETNTDNDAEHDPTTIVKAPTYISAGAGGTFGSFRLGANVLYAPMPGVVVSGVASGTVTFKEGSTTLGTAVLNSFGNGAIDLPNLSVGSHTVIVEYPGDAQFLPSTGSFAVVVPKATPTVELLCPAATYDGSAHSCTANVTGLGGATVAGSTVITYDGSSTAPTNAGSYAAIATFTSTDTNYSDATASTTFTIAGAPTTTTITGSSVTYPANVELTITVSSPAGIPTGSAAITFGGGSTIPAPLNSGVITLGISGLSLPAGTYTISVSYPAQGNYAASSKTFDYVVNPGSSGTSLTSSLNPAVPGNSITFTATVTGAGLTPSGNVQFRDGSTTLATVAVNAAGVATFTTSTLTTGTHPMTAVYAGDTRYSGSTSIAVSQVVGTPAVTITGSAASLTLQAGQSGNVNLSVGATGTLTTPVTFTCTGLPLGSSCAFSPASVGPTVPASTTLTISTTGFRIVGQHRSHNWPVTLAILMPGMLLLPAVFSRRKRLAIILGLIAITMLALALTGCGGGRVEGMTNASQSTPAGSYTVTVTGVSTGADNGTVPIRLTVNP